MDTVFESIVVKKKHTPGLRHKEVLSKKNFQKISLKKLTKSYKRSGGRNRTGQITSYHRGGGVKYRLRDILWRREFNKAYVYDVEYNPRRSALLAQIVIPEKNQIAYVTYTRGLQKKNWIFSTERIKSNEINLEKSNGFEFVYKVGSNFKLKIIPQGVSVHNVELLPGKGAQIARSAGTFCLVGKYDKFKNEIQIKCPSGKKKIVSGDCIAVLGRCGNEQWINQTFGSAGIVRRLGKRIIVRGVAMNPIDHPHGGGEGKSSGGRPSVSPWGKLTKAQKRRKSN